LDIKGLIKTSQNLAKFCRWNFWTPDTFEPNQDLDPFLDIMVTFVLTLFKKKPVGIIDTFNLVKDTLKPS